MHVPIHNHSEYSSLDGLSTVEEIAERCVELGCPCCGLTDHHTVAGHLEFGKVMKKHGIKPIFGCEVYHGVKTEFGKNERDQSHLVLGALNDKGLRNLWALMDASASNFRYVSRVSTDMLRKYSEGLFATSACALGLVSKQVVNDEYTALNEYLDIFRDNFYIEIHTYPGDKAFKEGADGAPVNQKIINLALFQTAEERGIPVIYADDAHRAKFEQYPLHDAYVAMSTGQTIYTPIEERKMWHPEDALYIKDEAAIRESLDYLPEWAVDDAISNSVALGEKCSADLPEVKAHLPVFVPSDCPWLDERQKELDATELFAELVEEGVAWRYGENPADEVWERVMHECRVYLDDSSGIRLYDYMLMGWDLVGGYCKSEDIEVGPGRGSSAGSIVAYCLGITDVDPLHYDLIFERFWNAGRTDGFPDIDMDFPRARRRDILHYLEDRWGKDRVRPIGTVTRMKPKSVVDKTWKGCAITGGEAKELKKILDQVPDIEIHGADQIGWSRETEPGKVIYVDEKVGDKIEEWIESKTTERQEVLRTWLIVLQHLCSRNANYGIHPSGIVVSDVDLPSELPCRWNKDEKLRVTMFGMEDVDKRKFVKLDVLGLRTLDTLTEWKKLIAKQGIEITWSGMDKGEYPDEMWKLFDRMLTLGLFQVEDKPAVRKLVKDFKPRNVQDCSIIVALNRPGPLRSKPAGAKTEAKTSAQQFVWRKLGKEPVEYEHPFLEDILHETYGIFLYQEQVIAFFNKMGYSLSESDAVRKILGKKKPEQLKALYDGTGEWEGKGFMEVAPKFVGDKAQSIWTTLEGFASYSFNKSHSVAYGTMTFRTAFAKYYGTSEFAMSCIITDEDRSGAHVGEARRMGIEVSPPDIRLSEADPLPDEDGNLRFGFSNIKGIGGDSAEYIVYLRDKYDVSTRKELEDALAVEKKVWQERKEAAKKDLESFKEKSPNQTLQSNKIDALQAAGAFDAYEDREVSLYERQEQEKELLGVILTDEVAQSYRNNEEWVAECDEYRDVHEEWDGEDMRYTIAGAISGIRETKTRADGKAMGIVTVEYQGEEVEFAVFPKQWRAYKFLWRERTPGLFNLRKTSRGLNFEEGRKLS